MDNLDVARQFGILNRQSQTFITNACSDLGIGFSECVLLMNLYRREGINQEDMSAVLFIDKAATARTIKLLEEKGFILRRQDKDDKRVKKLYLTAKGEETKEPVFKMLKQWMHFLSDGMDQETFETVRKGLRILAEKASSRECSLLFEKQDRGGVENEE